MPFPKGYKESRFLDLAEKIVDGLISQRICIIEQTGYHDEKFHAQTMEALKFNDVDKKELTEAISIAIVDNLTYGNLGTLTMRDNKGRIVAKLYVLPDGTLADDSWTCNKGWGSERPFKKDCEACEEELKKRNSGK